MRKLLSNALCVISVLFVLWIGLSIFEVAFQSISQEPSYTDINFFVWMMS